ncbi:hypothetical protein GYB22_07315 [bacterium]|nr:hypothetical protein [bacterium]
MQEDFWIELSREEKDEIRLGLHQLDQGEGITPEEFMKNCHDLAVLKLPYPLLPRLS